MRNLCNTHRTVLWSPDGLSLTAFGWDAGTDSTICAFGPTREDPLIQLRRWQSHEYGKEKDLEHIASWDAPCPLPDLECDKILDLHYFSDSSTTCLVLAGGDIIVVRETPSDGEEKIEIVGSVDVGISAASWSPDEDLLAIATHGDTLLYMTREFDNVSNISFLQDDLNSSKHVSVGWGKKETQFQGKGAKALRDPTMPERVDEGTLGKYDDRATTISWRGDGAYVAVNSILASPRRVIRVYSREGVLDGVSEPVDGLEGALSWRPAGNLLAGVQRLEDRIHIVFFERNGLRHGQFSLRISKEDMDSWATSILLRWNVDSTVLAVCFLDRVQLWTMGNYHYYLKQEIPFSLSMSQQLLPLVWHPEQPLTFTVGSAVSAERCEYVSRVAAGPTAPPDDYGVVAVIDGRILKLTPFRLANVPPPMALHEIEHHSSIVDVAISERGPDVRIALVDRTTLSLYQWDLKSKNAPMPYLIASTKLRLADSFPRQIVFLNQFEVLVLTSNKHGCCLHAFLLTAENDGTSILHVKDTPCPPVKSIVPCLPIITQSLFFDCSSGEITPGTAILNSIQDPTGNREAPLTVFPKQTIDVKVVDFRNESDDQQVQLSDSKHAQSIAFGLTPNGSLYANIRRLAKDCTSFLVTPTHLIFTTSQHLLKFVHITTVDELEVPPDTPEIDERCRSIERGAKLVNVIPSASALILQMPRGNLETIYPRALVLAGIRRNIDKKQFRKAFLTCRSQRVDMNIIHDHAPHEFIANVSSFIDQIQKVEHIDLFLSQLREEDVSKTMYQDTIRRSKVDQDLTTSRSIHNMTKLGGSSKVNNICDAFLAVLHRKVTTNLQNVITSHLCKIPPDIDAGLSEVASLWRTDPDEAEQAVEHICFLADVNRLYDNVLGLYDLNLTLLIAQKSQKDPREYLPFLQTLQEMVPLRRKYTIDDYLGRHSKALIHLHAIHEFEEFKSYMVKHSLYDDALHICRHAEEQINDVMHLYAQFLSKGGRHRDAGIAYEYLKDYTSASEAYSLAHLWKEALFCASLVPMEHERFIEFASKIEASLLEHKDYYSAALVQQGYFHDIESAARLFCKGYFFAEAILSLSKRQDLLESVVDAGLVDGMANMTELLAECRAQLNAQVPRLRELRIKKAEEPLAFYDGDVNDGADIPDNVSLAPTDASTTGGSLFTRYTNRTGTVGTNATRKTSKNRKREERKRARGKKGSVYEEEYLVNSVGRLVDRVNAVGDDVGRLVTGLMRRGMRERAMAVQGVMLEVIELCKGCVAEVFETEKLAGQKEEAAVDDKMERPNGGDGVLWDSMEMSQTRREAPLIKEFEKLSLLSS